MSSMNFSTSKQFVRPPQRGIFPLDHDADCRVNMQVRNSHSRRGATHTSYLLMLFCSFAQKYLKCLKDSKDIHHKCRELSREYLQCRMDNQLMSKENLENVSFHALSNIFLMACSLVKYLWYPWFFFYVFNSWDIRRKSKWWVH
jgi:hypothetical protein